MRKKEARVRSYRNTWRVWLSFHSLIIWQRPWGREEGRFLCLKGNAGWASLKLGRRNTGQTGRNGVGAPSGSAPVSGSEADAQLSARESLARRSLAASSPPTRPPEVSAHWLLSVFLVLPGKLPRLPGNRSSHQWQPSIGGHVVSAASLAEETWRPWCAPAAGFELLSSQLQHPRWWRLRLWAVRVRARKGSQQTPLRKKKRIVILKIGPATPVPIRLRVAITSKVLEEGPSIPPSPAQRVHVGWGTAECWLAGIEGPSRAAAFNRFHLSQLLKFCGPPK